MIVCAQRDLYWFWEKTRISVRNVMLTLITRNIKKLLSEFVLPAQPTQSPQEDLEANETVSASQDLSVSHRAHIIPTHAHHALKAHSQAQQTPQDVIYVCQESFLQVLEHQVKQDAQTAPVELWHFKQECPRASPVLRPLGRTWELSDT